MQIPEKPVGTVPDNRHKIIHSQDFYDNMMSANDSTFIYIIVFQLTS